MTRRLLRSVGAAVLLALLTVAVFSPGLSGGFLFDDFPNIVSNARVQMRSLDAASLGAAARAYELGDYGRPLATVSFALNYYFGGTDPWGYKLVGVLVHALNAVLVFAFVFGLWNRDRQRPRTLLAPFAIALAWAAHPMQVSTVLYVVQRMESLSLTFVLCGLLAYVHGRRRQLDGRAGAAWLVLGVIAAATGLLAKETAALFPLYMLCLELTVFGFRARSEGTSRALRWGYGATFGIAALVFLAWFLPHYGSGQAFRLRDFSAYERVLTQMRVLVLYVRQIIAPLPSSLAFYYDTFPVSRGWLAPATTLGGALLLGAWLATAVVLRRRRPLYALGVFLFFAAHALTSNAVPLELVFEHRNYFAILGVLLAVADLIACVRMADGPALKQIAVAAMIGCLGFLCVLRAFSWGSPLQLAFELVQRDPRSARAHSDLAALYFAMADGHSTSPFFSMAKDEFAHAARLPSASPLPLQSLILMSASTGQPVPPGLWREFDRKLASSVVGPQEMWAVSGLLENRTKGVPLDDRELAHAYGILSSRAKLPSTMYAQFAIHALEHLGDEQLAGHYFARAVLANPRDEAFAARLYAELLAGGHARAAAQVLAAAQSVGILRMDDRRAPASGARPSASTRHAPSTGG